MIARGKKIYLCRPDKTLITQLNGVVTDSVSYNTHTKDYDTLSFTVDEYIIKDGEQIPSNGYDLLDVYMNLYLEDIGYFQMQNPSKDNDGIKETKSVVAYSLEKEFEQKDWTGLKVNTGEPDSLEQLAENNLNDLGYAKEFVVLYRPDKQDLSLLHLLLSKMPGWSVIDDDIDPLLWNKKLRIEEENINLYALLTSVIAPKLECIFLFDTINSRVKAVSKERLNDYTYDTNIFIGFRNLSNSVRIDVDEDSVYTRFNCRGDGDLTVNDWNYNDSKITDLSYFLREPYMNEDLVSKVNTWIQWREDNREAFANLSKQRADINDKIYEIKYRVPNDGDDWSQWDDMAEELLYENLNYYNALLTSLQVSVDTNPRYDTDGNYISWKNSDGTVNHDAYLELLYDASNGYGGYYTYYEIINYIIPNIEIAIANLGIVEDKKQDYVEGYETNWELYGIEELTGKKEDYENRLVVLQPYSKAWSELSNEEKAEYTNNEAQYNAAGRSEYIEITGYLGSEIAEGTLLYQLKKLSDEVSALETESEMIDADRISMVEQAQLEHESYGFTEQDIITINTLFHDTDYTNTNILTTSVDTTITTIDREKELYDDSISKLSEVSQPQFNFTIDLDNLLQIPEFKNWADDFKLFNFVRVGLKDDYSVKLRMIGYSYNPCDITSDLNIEFSSMITSRSGRTDLTDILNSENNRGSKNSISIGTGNSDSDKEYLTALLQLMVNNRIFTNAVGDIASGTVVVGNAVIDEAQIQSLVSKYIKVEKIDVGQITGDEASFNKFFTNYLDADVIVGDSAYFKELDANVAQLEQAIIDKASVGDLEALRTRTGTLESNVADINTLVNGNLTSDNIHSLVISGDKFTIANGFIKNAMIENLAFDKITGFDINTTKFTVHSEDGKSTWTDNTIQISDANRVRVQMGKDGSGDYTLAVWDATGKLIWDALGATENTIQRKIIRNNVVADDAAIAGSKLDIESVISEVNGATTKLKSTTILVDKENQTLDVYLNTMETAIGDNLDAAKLYADGQLSTAQAYALEQANSALSTAKTYAENQAATAKSDAISTATADAASKAADTLASAKKYTDDEIEDVNTEITNLTEITTTHSTDISVMQGQISALIAEDTAIKGDYNALVSRYNSTVADVSSIKTTIGEHTTLLDTHSSDILAVQTKANTIESDLAGTKQTITSVQSTLSNTQSRVTTVETGLDGLKTRVSDTENAIKIKADQSTVESLTNRMATFETTLDGFEVSISEQSQTISDNYASLVSYTDTAKAAAISAAASDATTKANSALSNAKSYADAAVDGIEIGGRNLVLGTSTADVTNWYHYGWGGDWITYSEEDRTYRLHTSNGWRVAVYDMTDYVGENITISCDVLLQSISTNTEKIMLVIGERSDSTNTGSETLSNFYTIDTTDTWYHYEGTITLSKPYLGFYIRGKDSDAGTGTAYVLFKNVKFEKGNKATDWTPAPEDTQSQIDNTNATIATHTETLSTHTSQIAANESAIALRVTTQDFNSYKTTVNEELTSAKSRLTTAESSITAMKGEIALKVEQTDIDTAVNGIEIGGRNVIRNSAFINGLDYWSCNGTCSVDTDRTFNGHPTLKVSAIGLTEEQWYGPIGYHLPQKPTSILAGETWTISCYYYVEDVSTIDGVFALEVKGMKEGATSSNSIGRTTLLNSSTMVEGAWTKIEKTFTATEDYSTCHVFAWTSRNGIVWFADFKLEKGNRATDWTPAPEDIDASITDVDAKFANYSTTTQMTAAITAAKDNITQSVSATYATKSDLSTTNSNVSSLTTRVSSAESKLTKDSLVTTIGSYYSTQTYVDEAVEGIEIGGRNLLIGSSDASNLGVWVKKGWSPNIETYNADERTYLLSSNNGWGAIGYPVSEYIGQTLTISGWVKLRDDSTNTEDVILAYTTEDTVTYNQGLDAPSGYRIALSKEEWRYTSATFDSAKNYIKFFFRGRNSDGGTGKSYVLIKDLKIEKGNRATDWTPAPEDVDSQITSVKTIATQTADKFNWIVASGTSATDFTLTDRTATLIAETISLNGDVKVNGDMIVDQSITAAKIDVTDLFAQDITATGTITGVNLVGATGMFSGDVTATTLTATGSGTIGCWNFTANRIYDSASSAGINKNGSGQAFWAGGTDLTGGSAPFRVGHDGAVTTTNITAIGGKIGCFNIDSNSMYTSYDTLTNTNNYSNIYLGSDGIGFGKSYLNSNGAIAINAWDGTGSAIEGNSMYFYSGSVATVEIHGASNGYINAGAFNTSRINMNSLGVYFNTTNGEGTVWNQAQLRLSGNTGSQNISLIGYLDGTQAFWHTLADNNGNTSFEKNLSVSGTTYLKGISYVSSNMVLGNNIKINSYNTDGTLTWLIGWFSDNRLYVGDYNNRATKIRLCQNCSNIGVLSASTGTTWVTITTGVSDVREKNSIEDLQKSKEIIMGLKSKRFKYNDPEDDRWHLGFVAQDVRKTLDATIGDCAILEYNNSDPDEIRPVDMNDESTFLYSMRYNELIPPHIALTQEHEYRLNEFDTHFATTDARVDSLQCQLEQAHDKISQLEKQLEELRAAG